MDDKTRDKILKELADDLGETVKSVILHGPAAGPDYHPEAGTIDLLAVVAPEGTARSPMLARRRPSWTRRRIAPPLVATEAELARWPELFPVEWFNMALHHRVWRGADPLAGRTATGEDLLRGCRREANSQALLLRQTVMAAGTSDLKLAGSIIDWIEAAAGLARATLHLAREDNDLADLTGDQALLRFGGLLELSHPEDLNLAWELRTRRRRARGVVRDLVHRCLARMDEAVIALEEFRPPA